MIDLHTHVLPGVDDGVRTLEEAVDAARAAEADGIAILAATPHVREDYPTSADTIEAGAAAVGAAVAEAGIEVEIVPGAEVALDRLPVLADDELRRLTLGQTGVYLLVEMPDYGWPLSLDAALHRLRARGITAILAHPERNSEVRDRPLLLEGVVAEGALVQLTAMSLDGRGGRRSASAARALLQHGLAHVLASDLHAPQVRTGGLAAAAAAVGDDDLASFLTREAPAAILAGDPVGRPPAPRKRRLPLWGARGYR